MDNRGVGNTGLRRELLYPMLSNDATGRQLRYTMGLILDI